MQFAGGNGNLFERYFAHSDQREKGGGSFAAMKRDITVSLNRLPKTMDFAEKENPKKFLLLFD